MPLTIRELFASGGFFMWPLLVLSVVSILVIFERLAFLARRTYRVERSLAQLRREAGSAPGEIEGENNPLLRVGRTFIREASEGEEHCRNVTQRTASGLVHQHERGLRVLSLIGTISPLIGLLGTVWGMVKAFSQIASFGETVTPAHFADGIWTALLTTVAGLVVAIPAVSLARIFEARIDRLVHDLNAVHSHLHEWFFSAKQ